MYIRKHNLVPPTGEYTLCLEGMGRGGAGVLWSSCCVPGCHCSASVLHAHLSSGSLPKWAGHQAPHPPFSVSPSYFLCTEAGVGWAVILLKACRLAASVASPELQGAGPWPGDSLACPTCPQAGARLSRGLSEPLCLPGCLQACEFVLRRWFREFPRLLSAERLSSKFVRESLGSEITS